MAPARKKSESNPGGNSIKFLGTAGARFVMIKQLRFSAGMWLQLEGKNIIFDPGPGCIVRCAKSRPPLDATRLDACILTHRHLDHSNDINVMIEAMTEGGFKKKGKVFCPRDCLEDDPVIFGYLREFPEQIVILEENKRYDLDGLNFYTPIKNLHSVDTFGCVFQTGGLKLSIVSDTGFFEGLVDAYRADVLVVNLVFVKKREEFQHLCVDEAEALIAGIRPKLAVITHFGMNVLRNNPRKIADQISSNTGVQVIAAYDGMNLSLDEL